MKKLKVAGVALVALVVLFLGIGLVLPSEVVVTRDIVISAKPEVIFPHLNGPKPLLAWSPWAKRDPNATWTFEGPESGVGAKYSWSGNDDVGTGSQTITAVVQNKRVETSLDFGESGPATAWFELEPQGENTRVIWGLRSELGRPLGGWIGLMMDGFVGKDYEEGLANLKQLVER